MSDNEPSLFSFASGPHSHRNAPSTSARAAEQFAAKHGSYRQKVHDFALAIGPGGFTDGAVVRAGGEKGYKCWRPRRSELANERWILNSGREVVEDGHNVVVWIHRKFHAAPPPIQPRGRPQKVNKSAGDEREAICKWLRERTAAGWSVDLQVAAGMIEAGSHIK